MFTDVRSRRSMDRAGLAALLDYACPGDTLAVVRLDRLGRSIAELLATVARLAAAAQGVSSAPGHAPSHAGNAAASSPPSACRRIRPAGR